MRRPPIVVVLIALGTIALGETGGAAMSERAARSGQALFAFEAGLSFFHTHAAKTR